MQSYRVKIKYKVTNWREYNKALKDRYNVTFLINENVIEAWYAEDDPKRGAQFVYSDVAIETVLAFRILFRLPLRGACGFVESILSMMGLKIKCPDYTTVSRRCARLLPRIQKAIRQQCSKGPVNLALDGTGLKI